MTTTAIKTAANDTEFEARLHQLVFPQIRSVAPRLIPNMIGFELLDSNDNGTEAAGLYAFRVGKQMIQVPVFMRRGNIKGHNLMYLQNDDLMLPLEDDWVEYIINRQPFSLGRLVPRSELQRDRYGTFDDVASAFGKAASAAVPDYAAWEQRMDMANWLPKLPKSATATLLSTMQADDAFGRAVLQFYPFEKLAEIATKITTREEPEGVIAGPVNSGIPVDKKLKVVTEMSEGLADDSLTEVEREDIRRNGVAVRDRRKNSEITDVLRTAAPTTWFGPTGFGVYDLLDITGKVHKAVVMEDLVPVGDGSAGGAMALCEDGLCGFVARGSLTAVQQYADKDYQTWLEDLPTLDSAELKDNDDFVLVNAKRQCTPPLRMIVTKSRGGGMQTLFVRQDDYARGVSRYDSPLCCSGSSGSVYPTATWNSASGNGVTMTYPEEQTTKFESWIQRELDRGERKVEDAEPHWYRQGRRITILDSDKTSDLTPAGSQLFAGQDVRVFKVDKTDSYQLVVPCNSNLWPLIKEASAGGFRKLTVSCDGQEFQVDCGVVKSGRCSQKDALVHLVRVHGCNYASAASMLQDALAGASTAKTASVAFAVKHAAGYPDLDLDVTGGSVGNANKGIQEYDETVQEDVGSGPLLSRDINSVLRAAKSGDKSAFDTSMFLSLIRRHDLGAALDEMLPDMTISLDRWCRTLFLIYAHRDKLEEQLGHGNLPQIEDAVENIVKESGDMLLLLKKKSVEAASADGGGLLAESNPATDGF